MKFSIERDVFEQALTPVVSVVEKREMLPVLSNILIQLNTEEGLSLTGTDLELVAINALTDVKGESGTTTVNAKRLYDVVRNMDDGLVKCSTRDTKFVLESQNNSKFELNTLPAGEFPQSHERLERSDVNHISVASDELKLILSKTQYAMAVQDVRHYLTGMLLSVKGGTLTAVASDGHRLAVATMSFADSEAIGYQGQVILPKKAVNELTRLAGSTSQKTIDVVFGKNSICFSSGNTQYYSKLVEGKFADYEVLVNRQLPIGVVVNREELVSLIARAIVLTDDRMKGGYLTLGDSAVTLDIRNSTGEYFVQSIGADVAPTLEEEVRIGFNLQYLLDSVRSIDSESVSLNFKDAREGCIGRSKIMRDGGEMVAETAFIVMPMRI